MAKLSENVTKAELSNYDAHVCVWPDTKKLLWASISCFAFWLVCHQLAARVSKFSTLQLNIAWGCAHKNRQTKNKSIKVQRLSFFFFFFFKFVGLFAFWRRRIIFQISSQFCRLLRQAGRSRLRNAGACFTIMAPTPMRWYWFNSERDSQYIKTYGGKRNFQE